MRFDFYQLTRDPAAEVVAAIAPKILAREGRILVVSDEEGDLVRISDALWAAPGASFLANGIVGDTDIDARVQPILLSGQVDPANGPANGATYLIYADGRWRDPPDNMERVFYLFSSHHLDAARAAWRALAGRSEDTRHFWEQQDGKWIERG